MRTPPTPDVAAARNGGTSSSRNFLLIARESKHATLAAYYGKAVGKRVAYVDDWIAAFDALPRGSADSVLIVDDFTAFTKAFLARFLGHPRLQGMPSGNGILTALEPVSFSSLILRMLLARHAPTAPLPGSPELYRVFTEHGNEMHMHLDSGEVLCGALNQEGLSEAAFDCVPTCPHANRTSAATLPVQHLLISSCNTFTLGDGLAPPEFSLLFNMLTGWCSSVMAPLKHAFTGPGVPRLIEALAKSGFSLGALTERLNSIAVFGEEPDAAYVLLGDPEIRVHATTQTIQTPKTQDVGGAAALDILLNGNPAAEIAIPASTLRSSSGAAGRLTVVPLCETLRAPDVYFCFRRAEEKETWNLILFSDRGLPRTRAQLLLAPPTGLEERHQVVAIERILSLRRLAAFGVPNPVIHHIEDDILTQVRFAAGHPRVIDFAIGDLVIRNLDTILSEEFAAARHAVLNEFIELTGTRLWISQNYGRSFTSVSRQPGTPGSCPYCDCEITDWVYDDRVEGRNARTVSICARCGIIADHPKIKTLDVRMEVIRNLPLEGLLFRISVHNTGDHTIHASIAAAFHEWRPLGVTGGLGPAEVTLAAGEIVEREIAFTFSKPMPDYMQDVHVFTLTDDFELSCFTQKMISRHNAALRKAATLDTVAVLVQ